ncbi:hypothetical protein [Streptomyces spiralis]|uniref:hypothetical protein n=1 Tax=Streptomyces spiralis TaxID=66376 RepID=UPI0036959401
MGRRPRGRLPTSSVCGAATFTSTAWDRLFAGPRPRELRTFVPLTGARHYGPTLAAVGTGHLTGIDAPAPGVS